MIRFPNLALSSARRKLLQNSSQNVKDSSRVYTRSSSSPSQCMMLKCNLIDLLIIIDHRYDIPMGGRFPLNHYQDAITCIDSIMNEVQLVTFASSIFRNVVGREGHGSAFNWLRDFQTLLERQKDRNKQLPLS